MSARDDIDRLIFDARRMRRGFDPSQWAVRMSPKSLGEIMRDLNRAEPPKFYRELEIRTDPAAHRIELVLRGGA